MDTAATKEAKHNIEGVVDAIRDISLKQRIKSKEERNQ